MKDFPKVLQPGYHNHPKKCKVCRNKNRDEIEYRYMSGESPRFIVEDMNLFKDSIFQNHIYSSDAIFPVNFFPLLICSAGI